MNKTALIIISIGFVVILGVIFIGGQKTGNNSDSGQIIENSEIKDGIQYVVITARGGYFPRMSSAKAGVPTKLVVKTTGTYDCSTSLVIRSIGYQKVLPQKGEEIIDLGVPKTGESLIGTCSMGMYNFSIQFSD